MGRKRNPTPSNIIQMDFFAHVDKVVLKHTKPYYAEQIDGEWPPYAEYESSRHVGRQPQLLGRRGEHKPEFLSDKYPQHRWQKYCSGGHWEDRWKFSEDKTRKDGLRYYCDACEARMKRKRYWAAKVEEQLAA